MSEESATPGGRSPGLACIDGGHLWVDVHDGTGCVAGWCLWCGTAVYDEGKIDDGRPVGFTPVYTLRLPERFHRRVEDLRAGG